MSNFVLPEPNKKSNKNYRIKAKEQQQHASTESNQIKIEPSSIVSRYFTLLNCIQNLR